MIVAIDRGVSPPMPVIRMVFILNLFFYSAVYSVPHSMLISMQAERESDIPCPLHYNADRR